MSRAAGLKPANADIFLDIFRFPGVEEQQSADWLGGLIPEYLRELAQFLADHGKLDQSISDYSNYVTVEYLQ